jgi:hypothetical protein
MAVIDWLLCRLRLCRSVHIRRNPTPYGWERRCVLCGKHYGDEY